jgi:hypothetical protein
MNSKVIIVADATTGSVIYTSANNPDFGYVRLQQVRSIINDNGFLSRNVMSALIKAPVDILKEMNYQAGQVLNGQIIIKESLTPFNKKDPERDLKVAGKTGVVCKVDEQPIYRKTVYSTSSNASDITIQHTNTDELKEAFIAQKGVSSAIKPNEDFTL